MSQPIHSFLPSVPPHQTPHDSTDDGLAHLGASQGCHLLCQWPAGVRRVQQHARHGSGLHQPSKPMCSAREMQSTEKWAVCSSWEVRRSHYSRTFELIASCFLFQDHFKSAFFFFEGVFYNDMRFPECQDISVYVSAQPSLWDIQCSESGGMQLYNISCCMLCSLCFRSLSSQWAESSTWTREQDIFKYCTKSHWYLVSPDNIKEQGHIYEGFNWLRDNSLNEVVNIHLNHTADKQTRHHASRYIGQNIAFDLPAFIPYNALKTFFERVAKEVTWWQI